MSERTGVDLGLTTLLNRAKKEIANLKQQVEENGMVTALLEADLLSTKKELAERDRTIAQLQEMDALHTSGAKQLVQDLHTLRLDRDELRKALEEAKTAIQKNLAFANGKDEQSLLSAFNHINTALSE